MDECVELCSVPGAAAGPDRGTACQHGSGTAGNLCGVDKRRHVRLTLWLAEWIDVDVFVSQSGWLL